MPSFILLTGLDSDGDEVFYILNTETMSFVDIYYDRAQALRNLRHLLYG